RVGVSFAQGAVLADLLHRDAAGLPAVDARYQPLPLRERDDDGVRGGVSLLAEDDAASVAIVNLDEAGDIGAAAAMATLVVATSATVCLVYYFLQIWLDRRTQAWRR